MDEIVQIGVGCVLIDPMGRFLLSKRIAPDKPGYGEWSFPGGHPEAGESPADAALRELEEEAGIRADFASPIGVWTYHRYDSGAHYVTLYFLIDHGDQVPQDREPDKHGPWEWVSAKDALERPLFDGIARVLTVL